MKKITNKKGDRNYYKVIQIPHLKFTLYIQDMSKLKGVEIEGAAYTTRFSSKDDDLPKACIFFEDVENMLKIPQNFPIVAHEVLHVIQILCQDYSMKIEEEQEHTSYIMSYLIEEILKPEPNYSLNKN